MAGAAPAVSASSSWRKVARHTCSRAFGFFWEGRGTRRREALGEAALEARCNRQLLTWERRVLRRRMRGHLARRWQKRITEREVLLLMWDLEGVRAGAEAGAGEAGRGASSAAELAVECWMLFSNGSARAWSPSWSASAVSRIST